MRWLLAGLAFASLVGLAVGTTAIKAHNVATRARLEALERRIVTATVEHGRRVRDARACTSLPALVRAWSRWHDLEGQS